jgi:hypothetical protein
MNTWGPGLKKTNLYYNVVDQVESKGKVLRSRGDKRNKSRAYRHFFPETE